MLRYPTFIRNFAIRKAGEFKKINNMSNVKELPTGSILHMLDNLNRNDDIIITPNPNNPFYKLMPEKKAIIPIYRPLMSELVNTYSSGIIVPKTSIISYLTKFRQQNMKNVKFFDTYKDIPFSPVIQGIVSYNALFRMRVTGVLKNYRLTMFILANVIEMINKAPDREHFIHIPATNIELKREDFIKAYKKLDRVSIKYPELAYYVVIMNLMCEFNNESDTSIFQNVSEEVKSKINILVSSDDKFIVFNLSTLNELFEKTDHSIKFLTTLNSLSSSVINNSTNSIEVETVKKDIVDIDTKSIDTNSPIFTKSLTLSELQKKTRENTETITAEIENTIESDVTITPAQKEKLKEISTTYKNIEIGGVKIDDIISQTSELNISDSKLDFLENDPDIVDKSMLKAKIQKFDNEYTSKLLKKDIANSLISFNKHGMYLSELKEDKVSDNLNKLINYTVEFTDKNFKTHTLKFTLPEVDKNGMCFINGNLKKLKKQRINLPICKISETKVSLNSNYNKALVVRNTNAANNLYDYVLNKIIKKSEVQNDVKYKKHDFNDDSYLSITLDDKGKKNYKNNEPIIFKNSENLNIKLTNYVKTDVGYAIVIDENENKLTLLPSINPKILPSDYTNIGKKIECIKCDGNIFYFNIEDRFKGVRSPLSIYRKYLDLESEFGIWVGYNNEQKLSYYISLDGELTIFNFDTNEVIKTTLIDLFCDIFKVKPTLLNEYCTITLLSKSLPISFVLGYRFGMSKILNYLKVNYQVYNKGDKIESNISDIKLKFQDQVVVIKRVPLVNSLIFAGMNTFNLKDICLEDLDKKDTYYDLLADKGITTNILKGIDSFYDLFVDPITLDVLQQMGEPTNVRDILIRSVTLITTEDHKPPSSCTNFRFRSYEIFPSIMYREFARAYATYVNKSLGSSSSFSIKDFEISKSIMEGQLFQNVDVLNPIKDIKEYCSFSHVGDGGRTKDSFVLNDRKYPEDAIGIISEATVDNSSVALASYTPMDPNIINVRGLTITKDIKDIKPTEMLSATSVLVPGMTNDDK